MRLRDPRLRVLLITPEEASAGASPQEERRLLERTEQALAAGIRAVQLRRKRTPVRRLRDLGARMRELTARFGALLLVNGRVDVAAAVGADGVHLGGTDVPPRAARAVLGPEALIGASGHAGDAEERFAGADYLTFSPVFASPGKGDPVGLDGLRDAVVRYNIPVLALGGVTPSSLAGLAAAGASGAALIRAVYDADDVADAAGAFLSQSRELWNGAEDHR